jgi:hypothetical protein
MDPRLGAIDDRQPRVLSCIAFLSVLFLATMLSVSGSEVAPALPQNLQFDIVREARSSGTIRSRSDRTATNSSFTATSKSRSSCSSLPSIATSRPREEVWRNGKLIALASRADDDGTLYDIKGTAGPKGIIITSGKLSWVLPPDSVPASYWNKSMVMGKGPLVDAQSGRVMNVKPVRIGEEKVVAGGKQTVATHYRIVAETPRDIWYDASGRWVKLRTAGEDGSIIEWVLK